MFKIQKKQIANDLVTYGCRWAANFAPTGSPRVYLVIEWRVAFSRFKRDARMAWGDFSSTVRKISLMEHPCRAPACSLPRGKIGQGFANDRPKPTVAEKNSTTIQVMQLRQRCCVWTNRFGAPATLVWHERMAEWNV